MPPRAFRPVVWGLAALLAVVVCAAFPYPLTDGDSCMYAALGRDMATGGGALWTAPQWDVQGKLDCFHEHPPGAFWVSALVQLAGVPELRAALVANALWAMLAAAGVVAFARRLTDDDAVALLAGAAFLLHVGPLKYVQRAGLEFPFAACAVWSVTAALRLRDGWTWSAVLAISLAGAFLVRGAVALAPAAVIAALLLVPAQRPPMLRLATGLAAAALLLVVFDRAHASATGHGFWGAYLDRQVLPSFGEGGTRHSREGSSAGYVLGRFLLYSLPWSLAPAWLLVQRLRKRAALPHPDAWKVAAIWLAVAVAGPALIARQSSRYLFEAWVPASLLFAMSVPARVLQRVAPALACVVPFLVPGLAIGKSLLHERTPHRETAELLDSYRAARPGPPRPVHGPFRDSEDDGRKSLLRFHLGTHVFADTPGAPAAADLWVLAGTPLPPDAAVLVTTPLGTLVAPRQ